MRQVDLGTGGRQRVRRPVPAVAGLQHHLGVQARPGDLRGQPRRAVGDPRRAELLAILGHPDQHRPAAVQVHAHDLRAVVRFHKGPPIVVDDVDTPSMNLGSSYGEREAPLLHGIRARLGDDCKLLTLLAPGLRIIRCSVHRDSRMPIHE